jgi:hypothetical protein
MADLCRDDVFRHGKQVTIFGDKPKDEVEWVCQETSRRTGKPIDWHYAGGRAVVLTLGDPEEAREVMKGVLEGKAPEGCLRAEDERSVR